MKKRLLSVLLLVCMVLTLLPTAVFAEDMHEHEALPAAAHTHCYCGGSVNAGDHTSHSNVTYTAWTGRSSIFAKSDTAYVYLTKNITLDYHFYIQAGKTLYLCLNGHTLNLAEYNILVYNRGGTLYLCDCSADKTGTISGGSNRCISVDDAAESTSTFNMYGGTLRNGKSSNGAGVEVANGTMNMYGGTITENTATRDGGGIYVGTKGTLNLYGGTITNNTVTTNEGNHGGGVYVESNFQTGVGTISISGSPVITGNTRVYTNASTGAQTTSTENLYLSYGFYNSGQFPTITLGTLTSGADIGIWAGESVFSTASDTDYSGYFSSDVAGYHVEYNADKKLELKSGAAHDHTGGTATCTKRAVCSTCGREYGDLAPHDFAAAWGYQDETGHAHLCTNCGAHDTILPHTPDHEGHATEEYPILCTDCGYEIEAQLIHYHSYTQEVVKPEALKSAATCTARAVYYKSCTCGEVSTNGSETFESGDFAPHNFTAETVAEEYLKSAATCTEKAVYYKSCSTCGLSSAGTADEATFTSGNPLGHSWGEATYSWRSHTTYFTCTAKRVCQNDSTHEETATVTAVYSVVAEPTCLETGSGRYQASFEADWAVDQSSTVTLAALGHDFGAWTSNGNGTHIRICSRDASHTETGDCTGGTATCTAKAVCETCGGAYGDLASHNFTAETVDGKYLKSAATCTEKAVYYKSCSTCGLTSKGTADEATFESGVALDHDWGAWTSNSDGTHTRTCKRDASHTETGDCTGGTADCTNKAVCTVCGGAYGVKDPDNHTGKLAWDITETHHEQAWTCCGLITVAKAAHTFGDWVVTKRPTSREEGEKARTCSVCGYTETKVLPKTGGGPTYYTLVFESNGGSKITNVNERHGTVVDLTLAKYQPTRTGYDFTGWYSDKTLTRRVTSVKLYENMTVYAGWSTRELPFTDVGRGDWFFDDVRYVYETGLMNGVSATRFAPYGSTTRGMIVTILYRMEGQPAVSRDCPFTDVASGSYYERAITWAAANGIVTGHSSTIFAPDANITREQLAAILYRYAVYKGLDVSVGENTNILSYEDFASLSEYAIPAMQWACGAGILYGFGGSLLPDAPANRLQAAAILHRFCVNILN